MQSRSARRGPDGPQPDQDPRARLSPRRDGSSQTRRLASRRPDRRPNHRDTPRTRRYRTPRPDATDRARRRARSPTRERLNDPQSRRRDKHAVGRRQALRARYQARSRSCRSSRRFDAAHPHALAACLVMPCISKGRDPPVCLLAVNAAGTRAACIYWPRTAGAADCIHVCQRCRRAEQHRCVLARWGAGQLAQAMLVWIVVLRYRGLVGPMWAAVTLEQGLQVRRWRCKPLVREHAPPSALSRKLLPAAAPQC